MRNRPRGSGHKAVQRISEIVTLQVVKKNARCVMINLDLETTASLPAVLEEVARCREGLAVVYGADLHEVIVKPDDRIYSG